MIAKTQLTLENLRLAIHGVTAPFSCQGTAIPDQPVTLVFRDKSRFEVVRAKNAFEQKDQLKALLDHCEPAPFGHGKKPRYDRMVRDALQLKAEKKGFSIEGFDPESAGILAKIQQELVPQDPNPISAELYAANVYTDGGHFAPHKDTPRGDDMFGTLVVCLPSRFYGGKLLLNHQGVVQKFDWGSQIEKQTNPNRLHWAAFFGDVDHQIEKVWSGARVTLTYLLRRGASGPPPRAVVDEDLTRSIHEAWLALLADKDFLPEGGILGYPCCHLYHKDARFQSEQRPIDQASSTLLKGRDHLAAATAIQVGLQVTFNPYMFENCADETWQLDRFPTSKERSSLRRRMDTSDLEEALPIRASSESDGDFGVIWLDEPPTSGETVWQTTEDEKSSTPPGVAHLHSCDYSATGYFGNESSEVDLYTFAALHIEIPEFGEGPRAAAKTLKSTRSKRKPSARKRNPKKG